MRRAIHAAVGTAVAALLATTSISRAVVYTYTTATGAPGATFDKSNNVFGQFDSDFDAGIDGEFEFSGSDGAFTMNTHAVLGGGFTGAATDHAVSMLMDYNPAPPDRLFGNFWFGGTGSGTMGPLPSTDYTKVLAYADFIYPAGKPYSFRIESAFTNTGNGFKFTGNGVGTWQTVGGALSTAIQFGNFNQTQEQLTAVVAFGTNDPGSEITNVDDGSDPNNHPTLIADNLTLTIAEGDWKADADGDWATNGNWNPIAPDGGNATAVFGPVITAPRTVNMDAQHFAGTVRFDSAQSYTLSGTGMLTIRSIGAGTVSSIQDVTGSHTVSAPLQLWTDTTISVAQAGATLTLSNMQAPPFPVTITKTGPGTVAVNNVRAQGLAVTGGTMKVLAGGSANSAAGASVVKSLTITGAGSKLDLTNNSMVIDYTGPVGTLVGDVRQHLSSGRLTTSSGDANHRLGYGDNAVLGKTTFAGQTVDSSSVLVKYTFAGDANLDGKVDVTDLGALATSWQTSAPWTGGDFDYSGFVDVTDLGSLATNWQQGVGSPLGKGSLESALAAVGLGGVSVPEPSTLGLLGIGLAAAASRRVRNRRV